MDCMELKEDFVERTKALFGEERYACFAEALNKEPMVSVRYNTKKIEKECGYRNVPWAQDGVYMPQRPLFTGDPLFHAGCYYVQEASSMFVEQVVRQYVDVPVRALDLCAAPGGKSTHLLSLLPEGSLLVSNEPVPLRAQILAENVTKWGNPSSVVTKNEPADFAPFRNFFDLVVVDAPCSGEGMFRKDDYAVEQWSVGNVLQCAERQKKILSDIWQSLRPGGLLVYSTCTFNREENEDCVAWIAEELGAESLPVDTDASWGITSSLSGDGHHVYRFIPGFTEGEGFFLALLRKNGDSAVALPKTARCQQPAAKIKDVVAKWLDEPSLFDFVLRDTLVSALPKAHASAMLALQQKLRVLQCGIPLAELKKGKLVPQHALAMSNALERSAFPVVELEREQALAYLHRETLSLQGEPIGFVLLAYKGVPLGFANNVGNRANNLYPSEWRIRKNPFEL